MSTQDALAELSKHIEGLSKEEVQELEALIEAEANKIWKPEPGPQLDAFASDADLLLYGGAAGGGKTDLLLGLALTEHQKSVIFRRQSGDLDGLWERMLEIGSSVKVSSDANKKKLRTKEGRVIEGGHLEKPRSEFSWQGRPHDFIGFDEGAQILPAKMVFVMGWLRSATGHRCRVVIATNPPLAGEGAYLLEWFAPWLDPLFPEPAEAGELRYAYFQGDGDNIITVWVGLDEIQEDEKGTKYVLVDGYKKEVKSRTYIPSKLADNPYLRDSGYRAQIESMPEPMRTQLLEGDFLAGQEDHEWQVIPTEWVVYANERWKKKHARLDGRKLRMIALSCDAAMGGADNATIARLCDEAFFEPLELKPGKEITDGVILGRWRLDFRRDGADMSIDMTGGWGASAKQYLEFDMAIACAGIISSSKSGGVAKDNKLSFYNKRAELWWRMREALDPKSGDDISLPPDARLMAELTAPRWTLRGTSILVESKDDIRKRLGSSTDRADAIIQAWSRRAAPPALPAAALDRLPEEAETEWDAYAD